MGSSPDLQSLEPKRASRSSGLMVAGILGTLSATVGILVLVKGYFFSEPLTDQVRASVISGDWNRVVSLTESDQAMADVSLTQFRMRALCHIERDELALQILPRLNVEDLASEDIFLLGQLLIRQKSKTLGWLAVEAALKVDPKYQNARQFLRGEDEFRKSLGASLNQFDKVSAVPDGRALATLVIGLMTQPASTVPRLDFERLARLERSDFLRITSPGSARKILARLFLEEGHPQEAINCLEKMPDTDLDTETHWLLSRAFLVTGQFDKALQSLKDSHAYGADKPLQKEPGQFAGALSCEQCHSDIYKSQQQSRHAATIAFDDALIKQAVLPQGPITDPEKGDVVHRIERIGDQIAVTSSQNQDAATAWIEVALGSGNRGQTMIAKEPSGVHRVLHISYYQGQDSWDLTEKFRPVPAEVHDFLGAVINENELNACLNCHSTRFPTPISVTGSKILDRGIGCERCHGPGNLHIKAVEAGFPDPAISRPKLAEPSKRLTLCAQCHIANGEIPASDPRFIRFQATTLPYSKCYTQSGGQIDCVTCHNPHKNVETDSTFYEAKCLSCHVSAVNDDKVPLTQSKNLPICPVNSKTNCITCHMPKVDDVMPGTSFSDHHIRIHRKNSP